MPQNSMDANRRMVYSAMEMGVGREGMSVMCDIFNMPPPCQHKAWDNYVAALYEAHKKVISEQLQKARDKVHALHTSDDSNVAEIAVSDGTWSKRHGQQLKRKKASLMPEGCSVRWILLPVLNLMMMMTIHWPDFWMITMMMITG